MSDKPILFSGPMVRALLAGKKTQTRRVVREQPAQRSDGLWDHHGYEAGFAAADEEAMGKWMADFQRIQAGDRLYVREHWRTRLRWDGEAPRDMSPDTPIEYVATPSGDNYGRFRQGMHMPRWASRLTLTVTDVRVERLQHIGATDALAEGVSVTEHWRPKDVEGQPFEDKWWDDFTFWHHYPQVAYRSLWEAINGAGSWASNPWVVAYTFTVERGNIDGLSAR